eukprot:TRINITY_DN5123_c0_g1_i1.p1 TRINITY_DN5123_c0_g1~~TRINITY_DN5123_c0_g1_i1.p1  ORF type:complete len:717 (+),score=227.05 TRINITY_DN5123_c0_g1_i1:69-2219(+)
MRMRHPAAPASREVPGELAWEYNNTDLEDIYARWDGLVSRTEAERLGHVVRRLLADVPQTENEMNTRLIKLAKAYKTVGLPKRSHLLFVYEQLVAEGEVAPSRDLEGRLVSKAMKSQSGVVSITVLTSPYPPGKDGKPQPFSCKYNCFYCPDQPGQPRSYLRDEPAVRRANQNQFDPVLQFVDRASVLSQNGHPVDKVEVLVLGGTWTNYPHAYQEEFVRDLYYAANTYRVRGDALRARLPLREEQTLNESARCKIIGLTLETRPDVIDAAEIARLRKYGCTRVQIGVQHIDDGILRHINRGHDALASAEAVRLLKDNCFKIDAHLMPNLPGATPAVDGAMFEEVFCGEEYQVDQVKIYPCEVTPFTTIQRWHREGEYTPYPDADLVEVLVAAKAKVPPWLRLNRVIRDIPQKYVDAGPQENLREVVLRVMEERGVQCRCIRCREAGDLGGRQSARDAARRRAAKNPDGKPAARRSVSPVSSTASAKNLRHPGRGFRDGVAARRRADALVASAELVVRSYAASRGTEYFIAVETPDRNTIFGFCRLRVPPEDAAPAFRELRGAGLIRELHVYGQLIPTAERDASHAQNVGFGRLLLAEAERLAQTHRLPRCAVIAGVGSRNYYRKLGYALDTSGDGGFMVKELAPDTVLPPFTILKRSREHHHTSGYFAHTARRRLSFAALATLALRAVLMAACVAVVLYGDAYLNQRPPFGTSRA